MMAALATQSRLAVRAKLIARIIRTWQERARVVPRRCGDGTARKLLAGGGRSI